MSNSHEPPTQSGVDLFKIVIPITESAWHPYTIEVIWATKVDHSRYRIENIPFYAHGLSYHDVIEAEGKGSELFIRDIATRSGHSTYRCYLRKDVKEMRFKELFVPLQKIGCTYERATASIFALNIPGKVDYWKAYELLQEGEMLKVWDFEEGHRGHSV
jgi:hypothetical protein